MKNSICSNQEEILKWQTMVETTSYRLQILQWLTWTCTRTCNSLCCSHDLTRAWTNVPI